MRWVRSEAPSTKWRAVHSLSSELRPNGWVSGIPWSLSNACNTALGRPAPGHLGGSEPNRSAPPPELATPPSPLGPTICEAQANNPAAALGPTAGAARAHNLAAALGAAPVPPWLPTLPLTTGNELVPDRLQWYEIMLLTPSCHQSHTSMQ